MRSCVVANLPRAGLGNKLLIWARALIFAQLNGLPLFVSPWQQVSIGPILRREKHTRFYLKELRSQGFLSQVFRLHALRSLAIIEEPTIEVRKTTDHLGHVYVFSRVPHWSDYFVGIRDHRDFVSSELLKLVPKKHLQCAHAQPSPVIAVHVRMSDFRPLKEGEDFARVGLVRTPMTYFLDMINNLRSLIGQDIPVTIFSDGREDELRDLLSLNRVRLADKNPAIVDILTMAKSKVIILSAGSTFGMWAAFLSNGAIIHHPQHYHAPVRSTVTARFPFEGVLSKDHSDFSIEIKTYIQDLFMYKSNSS